MTVGAFIQDCGMVTYLEAGSAVMKNTGQIKLYDTEAFSGMRCMTS
jgi:hypothetical protein